MRVVTDILLLLWLSAAIVAVFFVIKPSAGLAPFRTRGRSLIALAVILAGGAGLTTWLGTLNRPSPPAPARVIAKPAVLPTGPEVRAHPERYLVLDRVSGYHGRDDAVLLTGGMTNLSGLPLADPRLTCKMAKGAIDAGTVSAVVRTIIPVGGKLIFAATNLGQADGPWDRQTCSVTGAVAKG